MLIRDLWKDHERYLDTYFNKVPGVYYTYDAAVRDNDGHIWVLSRTDDVINVSGHRISTMEIESAVMEVNGVVESAVIGAPDEVKGMMPVVFVTVREECDEDRVKLKITEKIIEKIGKIAIPGDIFCVPTTPKTPSGKIMRRFLRELIIKGKIVSDTTSLENPDSIEIISKIVSGI
jgi:acetyl-CoA synthetase